MLVGIAGTGAIACASAAFLLQRGHQVRMWSPRNDSAAALRSAPLVAHGSLSASGPVAVAATAADLCRGVSVVLIAAPVNGHRAIADALAPHLATGATVIVSSTASLSALYMYETARRAGVAISVASFGTTTLTARKENPTTVRVMTVRKRLGVSVLPRQALASGLALCQQLFGDVFDAETNALASTLVNINPVAHAPLALFNWTRIERAEHWPQYHYMTPDVAAVIERLDGERLALADRFGLKVRTIETHFAQSFGTTSPRLAGIAAELHAARGGPPGPTDTATRFIGEDLPYGLVFNAALGRLAGVATPATDAMIAACALVVSRDLAAENDLLGPLRLAEETVEGLLARV